MAEKEQAENNGKRLPRWVVHLLFVLPLLIATATSIGSFTREWASHAKQTDLRAEEIERKAELAKEVEERKAAIAHEADRRRAEDEKQRIAQQKMEECMHSFFEQAREVMGKQTSMLEQMDKRIR